MSPETGVVWDVSLDPIGGMQTQISRLAEKLSNQGHDQTILTMKMKNVNRKVEINPKLVVYGVNTPIIPIKSKVRGTVGLNFYWGLGVLIWVIGYLLGFIGRSHSKKFDVIHVHCSGVIAPLLTGFLVQKILKLPITYTVHCCRGSTYHPMNILDRIINRFALFVEKAALKRANGIIALTPKTGKFIEENYLSDKESNVEIIPDIIDFEKFKAAAEKISKSDIENEYGLKPWTRKICYVGRIANEKGWNYFADAIHLIQTQDLEFIFCGDGNEMSDLKNLISDLNLEDKVKLTGFVRNDKVASIISASSIVVIPSIHEEFGGVLLEAASFSKPVVASDTGGLSQNVANGCTGILVKPGSALMIAKKVDWLLNHMDKAREYGKALNADLVSKYSFQKAIDDHDMHYSEIEQTDYERSIVRFNHS